MIKLLQIYETLAKFSKDSITHVEINDMTKDHLTYKNKLDISESKAIKEYKQGNYKESLAYFTESISLIQQIINDTKIIEDFLKKEQEKAAEKKDCINEKLYGKFCELNSSILENYTEKLALMYVNRGIVNRDLRCITEAIQDYQEGLKHESLREEAQSHITEAQEMLAGRMPARTYTLKEIKEQAEQGRKFLKMMEDAKKRLEQKEAEKPENLKAEIEKYKALLAQKDASTKRSKKRLLKGFGIASGLTAIALAAAFMFGAYTQRPRMNIYNMPWYGWDQRGIDHVDEEKDVYYFEYRPDSLTPRKKIYFQNRDVRFKDFPELLVLLMKEHKAKIGDRGFTAYETMQILEKIDTPDGGIDTITSDEIKTMLNKTNTFDLKLESITSDEIWNLVLKK